MKKTSEMCFYDDGYPVHERMPRVFCVDFQEHHESSHVSVSVSIEGEQIGNVLTDNAHTDDGYRYHDVFHLSYLAVLGWSACIRKILGKKRKSQSKVDEVEDGARATSVEEGMVSLIFNYAEQHGFFENQHSIDHNFLDVVRMAFCKFEVQDKSREEWQKAILKGFEMFRLLRHNKGGKIKVDMYNKNLYYLGESRNIY
ncbi:hypothetical protein [Hymenobacter sp. B81]|uniref:hypothetical protein n=1 Tax=Hymenobacter sp. B81 TaxID=3344878 RepID=UPI0037DC8C50